MIKAEFFLKNSRFSGFRISGHSGYSDEGSDIVCASVSSAAMLTANMITDDFRIDASVSAENNILELKTKNIPDDSPAYRIINALYSHLDFIEQEYGDFITVRIIDNTEV